MKWREIHIADRPVKEGKWVEIVAHIRKNLTGEVRRYVCHDVLWDDMPDDQGGYRDFPGRFQWEENNYSCDCNRELFFELCQNTDVSADTHCGEGRFSVNLENPCGGEIYYREYGEEEEITNHE